MKASPPRATRSFEDKAFVYLLIGVTIGFGWILLPYFSAVFWGIVLAILFEPLNRRLLPKLKRRRTLAALVTTFVIVLIVIIPLLVLGSALAREGAGLLARIQSGDLDFAAYLARIADALPSWAIRLLDAASLGDISSWRSRITTGVAEGIQVVENHAFDIGTNTLNFVIDFFITVYLVFFLLRDGSALAARIRRAIPLEPGVKANLRGRLATVIRATVKGNVLVAVAQGALGGLAFWFLGVHAPLLWAALMAFLSLLPAIGAALVWAPVAIYFFVTGALWKGLGLIVFGTLVIGLVDNMLRPLLVGKDIKMPDYVVLISTLGGMAILGLNGFVIGPVIAAIFVSVWEIFANSRITEQE